MASLVRNIEELPCGVLAFPPNDHAWSAAYIHDHCIRPAELVGQVRKMDNRNAVLPKSSQQAFQAYEASRLEDLHPQHFWVSWQLLHLTGNSGRH
ncbi:hypothetical protein ED208_05490 [Stagnimonas aquatica]|uniref:Uncharacterized protein n=1 Tax=Stagnimonas aquatica TaxID=2689987 RepID=A0A3N0VGL3_9GAMM|nr:hypothetical protein ED208_05490 [Stagnimonas aquatica]